jgi:biotin carboxylase
VSFTLMLTATGGAMSTQTVRYAQESARHDIRVVAVDMSELATVRYFADVFETVPPGGDPDYVDRVCDIVVRHDVDLILPCSDEEALALAPARDRLEELGCRLACADSDTLRLMSDKSRTYADLRAAGLPAPQAILADSPDALLAAVTRFMDDRGEFVVKPASGSRGGRGARIIHQGVTGARPFFAGRELEMDFETFRRDFLAEVTQALPQLVCERLVTPAYDIDVLAVDGDAKRVVARRRLNPAGVPYRGYVVEARPDLVELGIEIAKFLGISWLYDFDVMSDRDGNPSILELNPRPSGSFATSIAAGVPLLDDLVSLAKGEDLPPIPALRGARTILPVTLLETVRT